MPSRDIALAHDPKAEVKMTATISNPSADEKPRLVIPNAIAIASGKGGVGKTWISVTLAHAMALKGRRGLLLDGDLGLANVDIHLGLMPTVDLVESLRHGRPLDKCRMEFLAGGYDIIAGRSGTGSLAMLDPSLLHETLRELSALSTNYEQVLIDLAAGIDRTVRTLASAAQTLLVVTTDEPTSLTDAYALIKIMSQEAPDQDVRIAVNMAPTIRDGERTYRTLLRACQNFLKRDIPLAGVIRADRAVKEAIRTQKLLLGRSPDCDAAVDIDLMAQPFARRG